MRAINAIRMGGIDVLPLVEGGKGVSISNGISSGNWAATGGVGTFSAVNADSFDEQGQRIPQLYHGRTRRERHEELVAYAIKGALTQARRAYELASGKGRIHANILWEQRSPQVRIVFLARHRHLGKRGQRLRSLKVVDHAEVLVPVMKNHDRQIQPAFLHGQLRLLQIALLLLRLDAGFDHIGPGHFAAVLQVLADL
jgi:hypothetical protein